MKILYFGRYELPDKDATANRVVANAKIMRALGHDVILAGWSKKIEKKIATKNRNISVLNAMKNIRNGLLLINLKLLQTQKTSCFY